MCVPIQQRVRIEQVRLLRFEKLLLSVAPVAIAVGVGSANLVQLRTYLDDLSGAKSVFSELSPLGNASVRIAEAEILIANQLVALEHGTTSSGRLNAMLGILAAVDSAHNAAQDAATSANIKLLGQKIQYSPTAQGGTPKVSALAQTLRAMLKL